MKLQMRQCFEKKSRGIFCPINKQAIPFALLMRFLVILSLICSTWNLKAGTFWVSPVGEASWSQAKSETPLNGTACASLDTANRSLVAGDTAVLRGGVYGFHILPFRSGTRDAKIVYMAHEGESPIISNGVIRYATYYHGLALRARSWIKVEGITFQRDDSAEYQKTRLMELTRGSSYNEIANCVFDGRFELCVVRIWDGRSAPHPSGEPCVHNWIHGCTFKNIGELILKNNVVEDTGGVYLGVPIYDNHSNHNTIELCTFYGGGHHNLEIYTKFNVLRSNFFHHEGSLANNTGIKARFGADENGLYGNRNIQIYDGHDSEGMFNLVERNRFGTSGPPPDDEGGDGLTIVGPKNIIRYNYIYNALNNGVYFKFGGSSYPHHIRFYNNTLFKSGRFRNSNTISPRGYWQGALVRFHPNVVIRDTILKNNIFYQYGGTQEILISEANIAGQGTLITNNWLTSQGNPGFISTVIDNVTDPSQPNLNLSDSSAATNQGVALTRTTNSGNLSTLLNVEDALYFQDGTWGSELAQHQGDEVAVGEVTNRARIVSIDYSNQTIRLSQPISWIQGSPVWLSKISKGSTVLSGSAPDLGAYEVNVGDESVDPPSNLRIVP